MEKVGQVQIYELLYSVAVYDPNLNQRVRWLVEDSVGWDH